MSVMRSVLLIFIIILSLITLGDTKCYARKYIYDSTESIPNKRVSKTDYEANKATCESHVKAIECATKLQCLWSKDKQLFESPTVKSIKYIPTEMMGEDEWLGKWEAKGDVSGERPKKPEGIPKIATWDGDVVYEYIFTDRDEHETEMEKYVKKEEWKRISEIFVSGGAAVSGSKHKLKVEPAKHTAAVKPATAKHAAPVKAAAAEKHPLHPLIRRKHINLDGFTRRRGLISTAKTLLHRRQLIERRRLLPAPVTVEERQNLPFSAIGLLRVGERGAAGGTIIWTNDQYIYVLVAAHDIWQWRAMYKPIEEYSFWPSFVGTEPQRLDMIRNAEHPLIRRRMVGRMVRSWMMTDFDFENGQRYVELNQYDLAILQFEVNREFSRTRATVRHDARIATTEEEAERKAKRDPPIIPKMVMYDVGHVFDPDRYFRMDQQGAKLFCPDGGNYCKYVDLKIKGGYCGGPILNRRNEIIAMQTARENAVIAIRDDSDQVVHPELLPMCCDACTTDCSNCGGHAARISGEAIANFRWIVSYHWLPSNWMVVHEEALVEPLEDWSWMVVRENPLEEPLEKPLEEEDEARAAGSGTKDVKRQNDHSIYNYNPIYNDNDPEILPLFFVVFVSMIIGMCCYLAGAISGIACYVAGKDQIKQIIK